jgi:hypothetical protein
MRFAFFCSLLLLLSLSSIAQDPVYRTITNQNGLQSNTVYDVLQDAKGFIWLGQDRGLNRFDGKTFKQFLGSNKQGRSVSNLLQVKDQLWCQDFSGHFYRADDDSMKAVEQLIAPGAYTSAAFLQNRFVVSAKYDSIRIYDVEANQAIKLANKSGAGPGSFSDGKSLYFFAEDSLKKFDGANTIGVAKLPVTIPTIFYVVQVKGKFYGITKTEFPYIHALNGDQKNIPATFLPKGLFIQFAGLIEDELWIGTSDGAYCFTPDFMPKYNGHCFFKGRSISKVMKDRESSYWFTTLNSGILLVPNINTKLYQYGNEAITALAGADSLGLYAGTSQNRILRYEFASRSFREFYKAPINHEVLSILNDKQNGKLLFASNQLYAIEQQNGRPIIELAAKEVANINKDVYAVAYASGLLLSTASNITLPKWLSGFVEKERSGFWIDPTLKARGRCVAFDAKNNMLYVGTTEGLYVYANNRNKELVQWNGSNVFASKIVVAENHVVISTYDNGVLLLKNGKVVAQLNLPNGFKTIYKIQSSGNELWMIADDAVVKYDMQTAKSQVFNAADGLPKAEYKDLLIVGGYIYIATPVGLVVLNNNKTSLNAVAPRIWLNKIMVNNLPYSQAQLTDLNSQENNINLDLSLLTYKVENLQQLSYKINDGQWQAMEPGNRNLNLPSLQAGKYYITITGKNEDGIAVETPLQLKFEIAAPFYKRFWFWLLIGAAIVGMVYLYFSQRLKVVRKANELNAEKLKLEQELQQSMLASIKSQMNPHFLFNALNTIQSYIYTNEKENASIYLGKFSELTRMILDMSNKETVSLSDELKAIQLYLDLEQLRFEDKLEYEIRVAETIPKESTYLPPMLIQPYIENAIKHGLLHSKNKWLLQLTIEQKNDGIEIAVDDNGIGREKSMELNKSRKGHQSFASTANQKRLEILNKGWNSHISLAIIDKKDMHGNALGTCVRLFIPELGSRIH